MGFFLIAVLLWGLILASIVIFIWGLLKKSWKAFSWSGLASLVPAFILSTQQGWFYFVLLWPLIAFTAAYMVKRGKKN
jgi:chromate transport protein ChrA